MIEGYVDIKIAAELTGEHLRTIYKKIEKGDYLAAKDEDNKKILISSLPAIAQVKFLEKYTINDKQNEEIFNFDMAAYKERFGEIGIKEFLKKYEIVQKALDIEITTRKNKTYLWGELAKSEGVSKRSLDRMVKGFKETGPKSLLRKIENSGKGSTTSTCQAAKMMLFRMRLDKNVKRNETVCFEKVLKYAQSEEGKKACEKCFFNEETKERKQANEDGLKLSKCTMKEKNGLVISKSISTISRIFKNEISDEIQFYVFKGRKAWEARYMQKATRDKPSIINEVWFGDHHVLDVFIKDKDGKIVKPWLTAWYDAASGCMVGWCLNTNPNSQTIAEAFCYGVCEKKEAPFSGLPATIYTDNGRDYRSHAFEGGKIIEKSYGNGMLFNIETDGILKQLGIQNTHAQAYHGWAKPIERFFGTFANRYVRELPGWCGNNPSERPEGFEKELKKLASQDKLLTMEELREWFINDVLDKYHNTEHEGYAGRKPLDIYLNGTKARSDTPSWAVLSILKMEFAERIITTQGITFDNKLYWHQELADKHLINKHVKIRYNRENKDTIIVICEGKFICAANVKANLKMVGEDEEKISDHIANQRRQEREVKERMAELLGKPIKRVKKSESNILTGEIINNNNGNVTNIEHEKAMKAYKEAINNKKEKADTESGIVDEKYLRTGEEILKKVMNK